MSNAVNRRSFLTTGIVATAAALTGRALFAPRALADGGAYEVPKLTFDKDALEPFIDGKTMEIHHDAHHAAYVKNLNDALKDQPELSKLKLEELLADKGAKIADAALRTKILNNGGGHYNHSLFWETLNPKMTTPTGTLAD